MDLCVNCISTGDLPEHIKVCLPALSPTMEVGTIASCVKKEGDEVSVPVC